MVKSPLAVTGAEKVFTPLPVKTSALKVSPPDLKIDWAEEELKLTVPVPGLNTPALLQLPPSFMSWLFAFREPESTETFELTLKEALSFAVTLELLTTKLAIEYVELIPIV